MENKINLFERSGACTREAIPEPNSVATQRAMSGEASGEQAALLGGRSKGGPAPLRGSL
jgi:hypothetical protein